MYIAYEQNGKEFAANLAPGVTPEQAVAAMNLAPGTWREITDAEAAELQKPTEEEQKFAEARAALAEAGAILTVRMQRQLVQAESFTGAEFALFAKAGLFAAWASDTFYAAKERIVHDGIVYEVQQDHTSQAHQTPGSDGMLAVYRPLSVDAATGEEPDGSLGNPFAFYSGMDVFAGKYYTFEGLLYLAKADIRPCVWNPGTAGLWQWELAE